MKPTKEFRNNFKRLCVLNNQKWIYKLSSALQKEVRPPFYAQMKKSEQILLDRTGDILYIFMVGIRKDYAHRHIMTNLVKESMKRAKEMKYKLLFVEASNKWSKKCFTKNGFVTVNEVYYKNWEYPKGSNEYPFRSIAEETGFDYMTLLAYPLQNDLRITFNNPIKSKI